MPKINLVNFGWGESLNSAVILVVHTQIEEGNRGPSVQKKGIPPFAPFFLWDDFPSLKKGR